MSYTLRNAKATDKKTVVQLGHFDLYNRNRNAEKWANKTSSGILIGVLAAIALLVYIHSLGGAIMLAKRAAIRGYFEEAALSRRVFIGTDSGFIGSDIGPRTEREAEGLADEAYGSKMDRQMQN